MSSAQKVTLENVNMMIDAGFNPLNQICDATGESMSDLYKRISDGKVSFSELEAAVEAGRAVLQRYAGSQPDLQRAHVHPEG